MIREFDGDFGKVKRAKYALLWFSSPGCPPCRMIEPFMHELSEEYREVEFWEVDVEKHLPLAEKFDVMNVPTLIYLKEGNEITRQNLVRKKEEVEEKLMMLLGSDS
ncbi:thioredoxin [Thermococcus sp. CX2]|uniref:thioredoxin family protein n=1 Tax=Thermococcus sp. CX2 TaxID=163006 RepID=UPI001439FF27|nr:thioredoxin family protein [Thermococcus sp. CX2]NJE84233.1 thioredoxin [Thermococcus sp. CX2]